MTKIERENSHLKHSTETAETTMKVNAARILPGPEGRVNTHDLPKNAHTAGL